MCTYTYRHIKNSQSSRSRSRKEDTKKTLPPLAQKPSRAFGLPSLSAAKLPSKDATRHPTSVVVKYLYRSCALPAIFVVLGLFQVCWAFIPAIPAQRIGVCFVCEFLAKFLLAKPLGGLALRAIAMQASRLRAQLFQVSSQLSSSPIVYAVDHLVGAGKNGKIQDPRSL